MRSVTCCSRGTASVEAVVMLPFFILLLAGIFYLHRLGVAHHDAATRARACAWAHALAGCPGDPPPVCSAARNEQRGGDGGDADEELQTAVGDHQDVFDNLGFLQAFVEGFLGESFATAHSEEVEGLLRSGDPVEVSAGQVLLCNPNPPSFGGFLKDIFGSRDKMAGKPK